MSHTPNSSISVSTNHNRLWTAAELVSAKFPPTSWVVPDLLPEGLTVLAGKPKAGKSWMSLNFALAVVGAGSPALEFSAPEGRAIVLALEDSPQRMAGRLSKCLGDEVAPENLLVQFSWPRGQEGVEKLHELLNEQAGVRLVVIDVLARIREHDRRGGSQYDHDYTTMSPLHDLATEHRTAVLVVHHARKMPSEDFQDLLSGTLGLAGAADTLMVLKKAAASRAMELVVAGRDIAETTLDLMFNEATGTWSRAAPPEMAPTRKRIVELVSNSPGVVPTQVAATLEINLALVKKTLSRMFSAEQVERDAAGRYYPVGYTDRGVDSSLTG